MGIYGSALSEIALNVFLLTFGIFFTKMCITSVWDLVHYFDETFRIS